MLLIAWSITEYIFVTIHQRNNAKVRSNYENLDSDFSRDNMLCLTIDLSNVEAILVN